ncbi:site-specific integrase, partial [Bacteroides thetaiotaomicron]
IKESGNLEAIPDGISEKKKAIAAYMREHPEVTSKSAIAKAVGTDRSTVRKYYNEIRSEWSGRISFAKRQRDMVCRCLVE